MPLPLPQLRRPPGLLRRPVEDPRTCEARRGNVIRGRGVGREVGFELYMYGIQSFPQSVPSVVIRIYYQVNSLMVFIANPPSITTPIRMKSSTIITISKQECLLTITSVNSGVSWRPAAWWYTGDLPHSGTRLCYRLYGGLLAVVLDTDASGFSVDHAVWQAKVRAHKIVSHRMSGSTNLHTWDCVRLSGCQRVRR